MAEVCRVFVMRHAQSLEDVDKTAYSRLSDDDMPLTRVGRAQARRFAKWITGQIDSATTLQVIISPCKRVLETAQAIVSALPSQIGWSIATETLIAKQDWGSVSEHNRADVELERYRVGVLRYRFPDGESGPEMIKRFETFSKTLSRQASTMGSTCTLIITHGFGMRVLLMTMLGWSEKYFESLAHPKHCEVKRLTLGKDGFSLLDEMRIYDKTKNPNFTERK